MAIMAPRHLAYWAKTHGVYKPPFKAGTPEYARWYQGIVTKARKEGVQDWPAYYAQAKMQAMLHPPTLAPKSGKQKGLFGGALTPAYRHWYYMVQCACRALPLHEQNWPEFFKAAREVEARRQGLKPSNILVLNPAPTPVPETSLSPSFDGPLRFDFTVAPIKEIITE